MREPSCLNLAREERVAETQLQVGLTWNKAYSVANQ